MINSAAEILEQTFDGNPMFGLGAKHELRHLVDRVSNVRACER